MVPKQPPAINAPRVVLALIAIFSVIHFIRFLLPTNLDLEVLLLFSFFPARYGGAEHIVLPGGAAAGIWSFVTYAFLHGNVVHLVVNAVWMLAFASPVARRMGVRNFLWFSLLCSVAGVLTHLVFHWGEAVPVVGASAAISGHMAAAMRFVFQTQGPLGYIGDSSPASLHVPALSIRQTFQDRRVVSFLVVWVGINLLMGLGALQLDDSLSNIAWEAHIGGLVAGLFLFGFFDRPLSADTVSSTDSS